jgi:hypothetical protein
MNEATAAPWVDRQLPVGDEVFLDHVGYFVADLDRAGQCLERLGFAVSPINLQQNADAAGQLQPSGTSNRLARLRRGFIEILAATHDTPLADQLKQALTRYAGVHLIALSHCDVPSQRARLSELGFAMQAVVNLRRHVPMQGELREVKWSVLRPRPGLMPEGRVQCAYCHTPELTWPQHGALPVNGADGLTDILLCVADRHEAAARFGRFAGRMPVHDAAFAIVPLDRGRMVFVEPRDTAMLPQLDLPAVPFMAGQALRCVDLGLARAALANAGVRPAFENDTLVCVAPGDGIGSYLLFHDPGVPAPWAALAARG